MRRGKIGAATIYEETPLLNPTARIALFLVLALGSLSAFAAGTFEPVQSIADAAIRAIAPDAQGNPQVTAQAAVDASLRMPQCDQALQAVVARPGVAEVGCNGTTSWKLYVPVKVSRIADVVVLSRPIGMGQTIDRSMLSLEPRDTGSLTGEAIYSVDEAVGYQPARPLSAGHALMRSDLVAPRVIRRGDLVVIISHAGSVEVRSQGKALRDGAVGDLISVENQSSRRQVQARVIGAGQVESLR